VLSKVASDAVGNPGARAIAFVRYSPRARPAVAWRLSQPGPCTVIDDFTQTAWLGRRRFVAPCGADGLQVFRVGSGWQIIKPGPSPLNSLGYGAVVWTGRELIAWSGGPRRGEPPNRGASLVLGP
jgi:hypothetical protein